MHPRLILNAGVVSRTGSTAEPLAVELSGFDLTLLIIDPTDVLIPAGQASQFFDITVLSLGLAASGSTTITATAEGQTATTSVSVQ